MVTLVADVFCVSGLMDHSVKAIRIEVAKPLNPQNCSTRTLKL